MEWATQAKAWDAMFKEYSLRNLKWFNLVLGRWMDILHGEWSWCIGMNESYLSRQVSKTMVSNQLGIWIWISDYSTQYICTSHLNITFSRKPFLCTLPTWICPSSEIPQHPLHFCHIALNCCLCVFQKMTEVLGDRAFFILYISSS